MKRVIFVLFCVIAAVVLIINPKTEAYLMTAGAADNIEEAGQAALSPDPTATPEPPLMPAADPEPSLIPTSDTVPVYDPEPPTTSTLSITAVGDLMCLYGQLASAREGGEYIFDQCFAEIAPIISGADIAMGNFETLVAESFEYTGSNKYEERTIIPDDGSAPYTTSVRIGGNPKLNAPESFLKAVADCGFDVLATANNHAFDRGSKGIIETMSKLDEYGIYHTGSYALPEDKVPLIVTKNGISLGIVSYTDISNCKPGSDDNYMLDRYKEELLFADIEAVKQSGAEFVIVYIHWGSENTHKVSSRQRKIAQFIADSGADFIFGSHAHCTQPFDTVETQRGPVPVIYSFGNFISSMGRTINTDSVIVNLVLEKSYISGKTVIKSLTYIPTLCRDTSAGSFIVLPTTPDYIASSQYASSLESSRQRTIDVLGETVALPE